MFLISLLIFTGVQSSSPFMPTSFFIEHPNPSFNSRAMELNRQHGDSIFDSKPPAQEARETSRIRRNLGLAAAKSRLENPWFQSSLLSGSDDLGPRVRY